MRQALCIMNMKRIVKPLLLVLLGVIICLACLVGLSVYLHMRTGALSLRTPDSLSPQSRAESQMRERAQALFAKRDVAKLNRIVSITKGEVELSVNGPSSIPESQAPVAEAVLRNVSDRNLTVFEPRFERLTLESYDYKGFVQDDFSMICPVTLTSRCRILEPGQTFSTPVLFNIEGLGKHKINLSVGFPVYEEIGGNAVSCTTLMIAREPYIVVIVENENAQHPAGG